MLKTKSLLSVRRETIGAHVEDAWKILVKEDKVVFTCGPQMS